MSTLRRTLAILVLSISAVGCANTPTPAAAPTLAGPTAGQLADAGKSIFATSCAKCHGEQGQGLTAPANIGANAHLDKYNTGKGLLDYIATTMPQDAPGSLSSQQYLQLTAFLLTQNKFVSATAPFDPANLETISLKK